jgi:hypothetical protein
MFLPKAIERFGVLSEAIQVKGAIALAQITRNGMHVDEDRRDAIRAGLQQQLDALIAEIESERAWAGLLKRDRKGQLVLTDKGRAPSLSQTRLKEMLQDAAAAVAAETGRLVRVARTDKDNISLKADDWEDLAPFHPLVRIWLQLGKLTKELQFFNSVKGNVVHPRYTPFVRTGRTSCSNPNIQNLPRKGGLREAFNASPGHVFLICDYSYIELRTLATVCQTKYGFSKLSEVIRAGVDPHCHTAAMFEQMKLHPFMRLKQSKDPEERERFDALRQRAKVLNFGIPGGLGPNSLVAYARTTYGVNLALAEATDFRERLIKEVYPELGLYLADDAMDVLAWNLGASVKDCWNKFDRKGERSGAVVGGIKRVVRGETCRANGEPYRPGYIASVWDGLIAMNRRAELAPLLASRQGSEELQRRLFWSGVTTLTGRVRGRVGFTQARNTPFQGLAADGAKLALWALIREGYRVVAFIHDEVVIEVPENADHATEARRVEEIMNRSMEEVTGNVPVACEYALSRRWSKKAKAVFDPDGRLIPWEADQP